MNSNQVISDDAANELLAAAKTDRDAFGELFEQFYPPIFSYCCRRLVQREQAEDVTSDVFMKVAKGIRDFPGATVEDFRRWLFRIATNEINASLRQSIRRRELLEAAAKLGDIDANLISPLFESKWPVSWEDVYREIEALPERDRSIISLKFFAGLTSTQIAETLELKPSAVRAALSRALSRLRNRLQEHDTDRQATHTHGASCNE